MTDNASRHHTTNLWPLFVPRGIAVVGASRHPGKLGASLARSLRGYAERGAHLALVNSRDETMHRSVSEATQAGPVDLAILCVPAAAGPAALAEAAEAGAGAAVVCAGGFAEAGRTGLKYQQQLATVVAETGIRVLGPNTSGFLAPHNGVIASFVPGAAQVQPGRVAVVAASGGVNHALAFLLAEAGHGVSLAVGLGNAVDVCASDVLDHLCEDPHTAAVALHIESIADGSGLIASVRRLASRCAVVALVVGRHDVGAFAASHTGALATSWRITRAALAQAGAVVVDDERELVDAVGALSVVRAKPCRDAGVGVVTAQAGPGLLLLDDLCARNVQVPELAQRTRESLSTLLLPLTFQRNPVDTGRPGPELGQVLRTVAEDPAVDIVAGYALYEPDAVDVVAAVAQGQVPGVPMVLGVGGAGQAVRQARAQLLGIGVAVAADPRGVAAATGALVADARARGGSGGRLVLPQGPAVDATGLYDEDRAKALLELIGIMTLPRRACTTRDEAHAALMQIGSPVAVKVLDAALLHKTEVGGVLLDVRTPAEIDEAIDQLDRIEARRYLVEQMAPAGVDLILAARRDPVFGPIVLLGLGGTTAEVLADVAIRLAPLTAAEAAQMPAELAAHALLDGWRAGPVLDSTELGRITSALGALLVANPSLVEIEINPLRVMPDGLVALDAVVQTREVDDAHTHS